MIGLRLLVNGLQITMITELISFIDPSDPRAPHVSSHTDSEHDGASGGGPKRDEAAQRVPEEPGDRAAGGVPPPGGQGPPVMSRPPGAGHLSGHSHPQNI